MIKNLVLEGGGVKGVAYSGVFASLQSRRKLSDIENVLGVSAGAIAAVFLAIGMTSNEIEYALREIEFDSFKDDSFGVLRDLYRFIFRYGKNKGDFFTLWLEDIIEAYTGDRNCTFQDLANVPNSKNLFVAATSVEKGEQVVFCKDTSPDLSISKAVRMSMSIPFFFVPVEYDNDLYVDGGVLNNFPINFFDRKYKAEETLGVRLDTTNEINKIKDYKHKNIAQYSTSLFNIIYNNLQNKHISKRDWAKTIVVDCGETSATDFGLTNSEKEKLVQSGWEATMEFFEKR